LRNAAKPAFDCDNLTIKFRHREIFVQILSLLLGIGYTIAITTTNNVPNEYMYARLTQQQRQHRCSQGLEGHLHQQEDELPG
jgi:hypothetical protein